MTFERRLLEFTRWEGETLHERGGARSNTRSKDLPSGGSEILVKNLMKAKGPPPKNTCMHSNVPYLGHSQVLLCSSHGLQVKNPWMGLSQHTREHGSLLGWEQGYVGDETGVVSRDQTTKGPQCM